jgi:Cu-Zn family superoxide dismutase
MMKITQKGCWAALGMAVLLTPIACSKSSDKSMTPASGSEVTTREYTETETETETAPVPNTQPPTMSEQEAPPTIGAGEPDMNRLNESGSESGMTGTAPPPASMSGESAKEAKAEFKTIKGVKLDGDAEFEEIPGGVKITVEVEDAPAGMKGVHIHEKGDCSNIEGKSMGEHFAPMDKKHGMPTAGEHHLGDLGNIDIKKDGDGKLEITVMGANLTAGDPMSFLGKAIVIHQGRDVGSQPSGGAGKALACGVIVED